MEYSFTSPSDQERLLKVERGQHLGIRTALGYRNSTLNNVIIAESKVITIADRANMLAKNFCSKLWKYGKKTLQQSIEKLQNAERYVRYRNPIIKKSNLIEAWETIKMLRII